MPQFPLRPLFRVGRTAAAILALAAGTALLALPTGTAWGAKPDIEEYAVGNYDIGGDFALTNQDGRQTGLRDFRGKVVVLFFGYTFCPDVCPLTLSEMGRLKKLLGPDGKQVQPVFVTIDPARDTAPRLKSYLANFDSGIVGLTGSERDIANVAKRFRARFARRNGGEAAGYLLDHTAFIYVLDTAGKVRYVVPYDAGTDVLAAGARHLLHG
jgi:protein SCO1/2